jgi:hypothetical protein
LHCRRQRLAESSQFVEFGEILFTNLNAEVEFIP